MKTVYVVNELCELENDTYNNCHGIFLTKELADKKALEIFEIAKSDIAGAEFNTELEVWNDVSYSKTNVDTCEMEEDKNKIIYSLNEEDFDSAFNSCYNEEEKALMLKYYTKEDMLETLRRKLEIDFCEEISAVLNVRILDNARTKEACNNGNV